MQKIDAQQTWSSRLVFLMAAVGAAVGLGNLWRFPYTAGVSGGAAFVVVYLGAVALVAIPIVMAELLIGRRGRRSPPGSFLALAKAASASPMWRWVGVLNVAAVFIILSFYSVIAGWAIAYVPKIATGAFTGASGEEVNAIFEGLLAAPGRLAFWHGVFILLTVMIVVKGLQGGIERAVRFLMPSLFAMLVVLVVYAGVAGNLPDALDFLFRADFSKITADVVLEAVGQAFFSVSVAMAILITYGSYLSRDISIPGASLVIAGADTLVALLAGLAIFPLVFANGLDPAAGPGLIFVTLPIAFGSMPAGALFGTVFFLLFIVSALTSSIAIMEPIVSWADDHRGMKRTITTPMVGVLAWLLGLTTVFSFNIWGDVHPLARLGILTDLNLFGIQEYLAVNIMLPLGGLLIAIFVGWVMPRADTTDELWNRDTGLYRGWRILVRYVCPIAVGGILVSNWI